MDVALPPDLSIDAVRTPRLVLAPAVPDDLDAVHAWFSDPRTCEHVPAVRHTDPEQTRSLIERQVQGREREGLASWVVRLREDVPERGLRAGEAVGWGGASPCPFEAWNLGYRLDPRAWGMGVATEVSWAALAAARSVRPGRPVTGRVLAHNPASVAVLRKVGMAVRWEGDAWGTAPGAELTRGVRRMVLADRPLDSVTLDALVALG
ncbi:GNAT family N-acetyltransferase [Cellulomonas sp. PhB143]|uniref:GNAT family N-acetyltransferase n=1 Tax=Cellulomonas sp. PhB143 TaxID=2485186 RepID=UPI000F49C59E|nr:GNAT family N-acetyltransferase [Cellulomonas sp. PhB143]ROS77048.1 RimJ/RimL family protein N-acetyltransferase [Cellulomonas sp. PhB143]